MAISDQNPQDTDALNNLVAAENGYNSIEIRQSKSLISELEDLNGNLASDQKIIAETLVHHFKEKFQYQQTEKVDSLLEVIPNVVTEEDEQMLDAIPDVEEIKSTIFSMDPDSSPGLDGFSGCFYRACWNIIQHDVVQAVQFCWRRQFIPKGLNSNFLALLPKTDGAKTPNQFRTIGLSNVSFKIFTKIINTRLSSLLPKLISHQQVAYIKGRSIQEQIMLASEMVNEMKKNKRGGNVGLKLDISQAYDSVSWDFLFKVLSKYGFSNSLCHWLKILFESARISVMVNGGTHGFFSVGMGLRQGDPLSPTLFVIMEDILSRSIHQRVAESLIQPMVIRKGIHPTHLFFAEDVFLFCNRAKKSITNLMKLLDEYQKGSGQLINKMKRKLFIDGTSLLRKNQIKENLQMELSNFPEKYLGVILSASRVKVSTVWPMVELLQRKLAAWKGKLISFQDRINVWHDIWIGDAPLSGNAGSTSYAINNMQFLKVADLIQNGKWCIPNEIQPCSRSSNLPDIGGGQDLLFPDVAFVKKNKIAWVIFFGNVLSVETFGLGYVLFFLLNPQAHLKTFGTQKNIKAPFPEKHGLLQHVQ
ncbi:uncharacterized protein LOC113279031 [Papaver somniferum]|uniref:uncharacterized protein LOC113279031 n=1 Tax=Papaver somniferum TaxID=3469 RepID=UPI000E7058C8|nr:uncharacterized protein LOC113279031 [Papaver somniferum]